MDTLTVCGIQFCPVKDFDRMVEIRAERHEHLRGRNNVTSCRSSTRHFNSILVKSELKKKRHLEFLRRRSVSPELCDLRCANSSSMAKPSTKTFSIKHNGSFSQSETLQANIQNTSTAKVFPVMRLTPNRISDGPSTNKWAPFWSEQAMLMRQGTDQARMKSSTATPAITESTQHSMKSMDKIENSLNVQKRSIKTFTLTEKIQQQFSEQTEIILHKKMLRETSVQTESGFVTVKESDVQQLAGYLQEALWREEAVKSKLSALQESMSKLTNSSKLIWTARCSEDLLRSKIKALEAQLQVCLQSPKDGGKKLMLQMEKQKLVYEEKALVALQKATQDKTEALSRAEAMQEGLMAAQAEAQRWQSLYEELKLSNGQLRENLVLTNEQLQWLHSQVELSRAIEIDLKEEILSLRKEKKELQCYIGLLEEENQMLREELQHLKDDSDESRDVMMQRHVTSEEAESRVAMQRDSQVEEQHRHTEEKLRLKERECLELQTELDAMELECQCSQARLSQCRDELRQLGQSHRRMTLCDSWWRVSMFFLLLLVVVEVSLLWLWYPPFREQIKDLYADIETRIEDYLMEMASPQHSGCFRPV